MLALYFLTLTKSPVFAQIKIDTSFSASYLVNEILIGKGVLVGNVTYKGTRYSMGLFSDETSQVGISEGIILSTGNVFYSAGPNKNPRTGWASDAEGDEDLDDITKGVTFDASVLEFDFITTSENLVFNFVFASEEYQEYVGSKFNDVFGFFLNGPNADHVNLATLPDGKTPITINNINHETGQNYYVDNPYYNNTDPFVWDVRKRKVIKNKRFQKKVDPPRYDIQFDGFTKVLVASYYVIPNEIYHIKMAIADVSDGILDSGVFLEAGSFSSFGDEVVTIDKSFKIPEPGPMLAAEQNMTLKLRKTSKAEELAEEEQPEDEASEIATLNVLFDFDSYAIKREGSTIIKNVVNILNENPELGVIVIGHTDNKGTDNYNLALSKYRSNSVVNVLLAAGIDLNRIQQQYLGEANPIETNDTDEGRSRNRRVEFRIKQPVDL